MKNSAPTSFHLRISRPLQVALIAVVLVLFTSAWWTVAAGLDAPAGPNDSSAQSYTLADVCNQLEDGTEPTLATSFTEPESAPDQDMCSLNDIYGLTPQPDPTNAAQAADVLSTKTFWALNPAGQWGLTTGTLAEFAPVGAVLAATGQDTCYDVDGNVITCAGTGQDGEYQLGATASPRFTDNADGTVTDNLTGLIWLKNANCFGTRVWETALTDANGLASGSCGLTDGSVAGDWRLPNITELESLVNLQNSSPSLPTGHPFTSVVSDIYWSSTTRVDSPASAWRVNFFTGGTTSSLTKTNIFYVWPVR